MHLLGMPTLEWMNYRFGFCHFDILVSFWHLGVILTFWCRFDILVSFWHFVVILKFWCLFNILVSFWNFGVILTFRCHFDILVPFWHFGVILTFWCHFDILVPFWRFFALWLFVIRHLDIRQFGAAHLITLCHYHFQYWWSFSTLTQMNHLRFISSSTKNTSSLYHKTFYGRNLRTSVIS